MWGNRDGILDALFDFAKKYPNVILEFKTKSSNISHFLENDVPKNIIVTWSLNTQTIIDNEEHLTASLDERIGAARKLADKGVLVGFHFHPIVVYENYLEEYGKIYERLVSEFTTDEVVLISMGTLTFIKPVIKKLRERELKSKILQMPFEDINGKKSYSIETKKEMFKHLYDSFKPWHNKVYFYMCMEAHSLWMDVFGYEYSSNYQMEDMMKMSYMSKINNLSK
jgi:spore photoproduct lyase